MSAVKLYSSWFCPFAQRAWIALELKRIPYTYIEVDPYDKSDEWLAINPCGLVPALVHNDEHYYESSLVIQYLDETFVDHNPSLYPCSVTHPHQRFLNRWWIDRINKEIIRSFYEIVQFPDTDERHKSGVNSYFSHLTSFVNSMDEKGPFFNGSEMSAVDITLLPWTARMFLLKHYRNIDEQQFIECDSSSNALLTLDRYNLWWNACQNHSAFQVTRASDEDLIQKYLRYAQNTAQSKVAIAINENKPLP